MRFKAARLAISLVLQLALIGTLVFVHLDFCYAQVLPAALHRPGNADELQTYYRERLVEIHVKATKKDTGLETEAFGTGFLVSGGIVVTARHVIEPVVSLDYDPAKSVVEVFMREGYQRFKIPWVPGTFVISNRADVGLFKVRSEGGRRFKYLCIDINDPKLGPNDTLTMASTRHLGNPYNQTDFTFSEHIRITHPAGPGDMYRYVALEQPIEASMSGGAVIRERDDKIIAVMSNVLAQGQQEIKGENYANLLQSATDLGLNAI